MKLSTKIGNKWTFSVIWLEDQNRPKKPHYMRITYQRFNTKTNTLSQNKHNRQEEFLLLKELAEIAFALGYERKKLIHFVVEYKNEISKLDNPIEALGYLKHQIKDLEFAKQKFKRAVQSLSK